ILDPYLISPFFSPMHPPPPRSPLFPYTTLFRSLDREPIIALSCAGRGFEAELQPLFGIGRHLDGRNRLAAAEDRRLPAAERLQRSEEHTSELQSRGHLVCRLLLEKKKKTHRQHT